VNKCQSEFAKTDEKQRGRESEGRKKDIKERRKETARQEKLSIGMNYGPKLFHAVLRWAVI
jgi:hypothetical protein